MIVILGCGGRTYGRIDHLRRDMMTDQAYVIAFERAKAERQFLNLTLSRLANSQHEPIKFVAGGAKGADTGVRLFAHRGGYGFQEFKADWRGDGNKAGVLRNIHMFAVSTPKIVIGFCGGAGTSHMVNHATKKGCQHVLRYTDADIDNFMASADFRG